MITKEDITKLISEAYAKASLDENRDMRITADLFESIRSQLDISNPYTAWDFIILDRVKFENDYALGLLSGLKESYFNLLFLNILDNLTKLYKTDKKEASNLWIKHFSDAAVHFFDDFLCLLCSLKNQWSKKQTRQNESYSKLPKYIRESRWSDAYPFYMEIAGNADLSNQTRGTAEIILTEIILFFFPDPSQSLKHIERAKTFLPEHFLTKRAEAEYYMKTGEIQRARNSLLQVISMKSGDYVAFNLMGDCFLEESMLENAESWYNDAIKNNFLQAESYKRLLNLYGNKNWIKEKGTLRENILVNIEKRGKQRNAQTLIDKYPEAKDCFKNLILYECYRDVAASWYAVQDYEKSEEWYLKAVNLFPDVVSAVIDFAYVKMNQSQHEKALEFFKKALEIDKESYEAYWGLAYYHETKGQMNDALKYYKECIRLRPYWSDWVYNFIGNMYFAAGEYKESEVYYRKAVELNSNLPVYRQNLAGAIVAKANILADESKFKEAEKLFLFSVSIDNTSNRWNAAGNFYYKFKKWKEAGNCYEKAISLNEKDPVLYENRGLAYEQMKKNDLAEKYYRQSIDLEKESGRSFNRLGVFFYNLKNYEKSIEFYKKALEREPDNSIYLENICLSYEMLNDLDSAEPYYLRLLKIDPENANTMNLLGILYYKRKNYEKAAEYYNKAVNINGNEPVYYENLNLLYTDLKQYPLAIEALQNALKLKPDNDINWNNLGVHYYNTGDCKNAIKSYNKAIELKPKVSLYYQNVASAYDMMKDYEKAIPYYEKAIELESANAEAFNSMGVNFLNQFKNEQAVTSFRKAVEIDDSNVVYQRNLGHALEISGKKDEAKTVLQKAIKLKEDFYLSWNDLGVLYYDEGNLDEALKCYNKSISLNPEDPVLFVNLALALNAKGKITDALNVTSHPLLKNEEIRKQVENMLRQTLPFLFTAKN